MHKFLKPFALAASFFAMTCLAGVPETMFSVSFVREAEAGPPPPPPRPPPPPPPRPMAVVTAAAVTTAVVASTSAQANAAAQANQAAAQANKAAADAKAAAASTPAVGTVVTTLPPGCAQTKLNNVDYLRCGSTYYKPAMVGDAVVFVVAQP